MKENEILSKNNWSNPAPAGLVALAVACFGFFALLSGKVTEAALPLLGCWLIGGFIVQLVVGLIDLKGGNKTGGNTFLFFSAFFMLVGGIEMFIKSNVLGNKVLLDTHIDGWAWLALTIVLLLWTPAFFKTPLVLSLIILALDVACPFIAFIDMGVLSKDLRIIPAVALLIAGCCGIYLSSALVVNNAFGKTVYPNPGPIIK
jgi:succinate-acetate transporter protein